MDLEILCAGYDITTENGIKKCAKNFLDIDDVQMQLFIVYGVFGGLIVFLTIFVFVQCSMIMKLKKNAKNVDPLVKRGYTTYQGQENAQPQHGAVPRQPTLQHGANAGGGGRFNQTQPQQPSRQGYNSSAPAAAAARSARPSSGYGNDNGGFNSNSNNNQKTPGGKQKPNWGDRFDKGVDRFDNAQSNFNDFNDGFQAGTELAGQLGADVGEIPGMDMAGDIGGFAEHGADIGKGMSAFKNKGFKKPKW